MKLIRTHEGICELITGNRTYRLAVIEVEGGDRFWAISGSKKGGRHLGGGIPIPNRQTLYGICNLLQRIAVIQTPDESIEAKVDLFSFKNRVYCGETREIYGKWYYRIKAYSNFFVRDRKVCFYKNHELRPVGRGFYIQEFDFPISHEGVEEVICFANSLKETIEDTISSKFLPDSKELIRNDRLLCDRELPWLNTPITQEVRTLGKPLFGLLCDKLREGPLTTRQVSSELEVSSSAIENHLCTSARYAPDFLREGFLLDRVNTGFDSLNYLINQIPNEALNESPTLLKLFDINPIGKWPAWKKATFSNDEYSKARAQSLSFAQFELDTFEGGLTWGLVPEVAQLRALAIRLFDLLRHYKKSNAELDGNLDSLVRRFIKIAHLVENE